MDQPGICLLQAKVPLQAARNVVVVARQAHEVAADVPAWVEQRDPAQQDRVDQALIHGDEARAVLVGKP